MSAPKQGSGEKVEKRGVIQISTGTNEAGQKGCQRSQRRLMWIGISVEFIYVD
jgi:hypothetical protein